jgi:hypothetical protein
MGIQAAKWWQQSGRLPSLLAHLVDLVVLLVLLARPGPAAGQVNSTGIQPTILEGPAAGQVNSTGIQPTILECSVAECMATQRGNGRCDAQCDVEACGFDCNCETGIADCDTPCDCGSLVWVTGTPAASILIYAYALVGLPWLAVLACMNRSWLDEFSETTTESNAVLVKPSSKRSRPVIQAATPTRCPLECGLPWFGPTAIKIGHVLMYGCAVVGTLMVEWAASPTQTSSGLSGISARGVERTNEATTDANPQMIVVHALVGGLLLVTGGLYYLFQLFVFGWVDPLRPAHPAAHYRALLANATSYPATIEMMIWLGQYKADRTMQATSVDQSDEVPPGMLEEATAPLLRVEFEVAQSEDAAAAASFAEQRQAFQRENKSHNMRYHEVCKVSDGPLQAWGSSAIALEGGLVTEKPAPTLASAAVRWLSALAGLGWAYEAYIQRCTALCTIRVRKRFFLPGATQQLGPDGADPFANLLGAMQPALAVPPPLPTAALAVPAKRAPPPLPVMAAPVQQAPTGRVPPPLPAVAAAPVFGYDTTGDGRVDTVVGQEWTQPATPTGWVGQPGPAPQWQAP